MCGLIHFLSHISLCCWGLYFCIAPWGHQMIQVFLDAVWKWLRYAWTIQIVVEHTAGFSFIGNQPVYTTLVDIYSATHICRICWGHEVQFWESVIWVTLGISFLSHFHVCCCDLLIGNASYQEMNSVRWECSMALVINCTTALVHYEVL